MRNRTVGRPPSRTLTASGRSHPSRMAASLESACSIVSHVFLADVASPSARGRMLVGQETGVPWTERGTEKRPVSRLSLKTISAAGS